MLPSVVCLLCHQFWYQWSDQDDCKVFSSVRCSLPLHLSLLLCLPPRLSEWLALVSVSAKGNNWSTVLSVATGFLPWIEMKYFIYTNSMLQKSTRITWIRTRKKLTKPKQSFNTIYQKFSNCLAFWGFTIPLLALTTLFSDHYNLNYIIYIGRQECGV